MNEMKYFFGVLSNLLIHSNIYIALGAVGSIYASMLMLDMPTEINLLLITFLVTFAVYNINRRTDTSEDKISHPIRHKFIAKFQDYLAGAAVVSYIFAAFFTLQGNPWALIIILIPLIVVSLYSVKWVIAKKPTRLELKKVYGRLKEIPVVKNFVVGFTWSFAVTSLPILYLSYDINLTAIAVFVFIFLRIFIGAVAFDIKDIEADRIHNIMTLPILWGVHKTKSFLIIANIFSFVLILLFTFSDILPPIAYLVNLASLYSILCIYLIDKIDVIFVCDVLIDGEYILIGLLALLGKIFI